MNSRIRKIFEDTEVDIEIIMNEDENVVLISNNKVIGTNKQMFQFFLNVENIDL